MSGWGLSFEEEGFFLHQGTRTFLGEAREVGLVEDSLLVVQQHFLGALAPEKVVASNSG